MPFLLHNLFKLLHDSRFFLKTSAIRVLLFKISGFINKEEIEMGLVAARPFITPLRIKKAMLFFKRYQLKKTHYPFGVKCLVLALKFTP